MNPPRRRKNPTKPAPKPSETPQGVGGWQLYAHPVFLAQLDRLMGEVRELRGRHPAQYQTRNATKRLAAIFRLVFEVIPGDPTRPEYRQGGAPGQEHRHWFRAKFFQQYRLFFRYRAAEKIILFAWVNDEDTKRAYGSGDDSYQVFTAMLERGQPPGDWAKLLEHALELSGNHPER